MDWWEVGKQINRDYYGPRLLEASGLGALFPEATINWEHTTGSQATSSENTGTYCPESMTG